MFLDYDRSASGYGWDVFQPISGRTLVIVPFRWLARLLCALADHLGA